ncbi:MAG: hypothetical protein CW342_10670 [Thermoactinomycetaceae bacterium]|nr:hypothetical protein [Bacillota bacterium]MBO2533330.1 hypothetical protein [Thermoactinomycetaceae bacterium]
MQRGLSLLFFLSGRKRAGRGEGGRSKLSGQKDGGVPFAGAGHLTASPSFFPGPFDLPVTALAF